MKKIALITLACLLAASLLAFLANYLIYTPMLKSNAAMINDQYKEITQLARFNNDLKQTLATQESLLSSQQAEISTLQDEIAALETENRNLRIELARAEATINDLEKELSECEKRGL